MLALLLGQVVSLKSQLPLLQNRNNSWVTSPGVRVLRDAIQLCEPLARHPDEERGPSDPLSSHRTQKSSQKSPVDVTSELSASYCGRRLGFNSDLFYLYDVLSFQSVSTSPLSFEPHIPW